MKWPHYDTPFRRGTWIPRFRGNDRRETGVTGEGRSPSPHVWRGAGGEASGRRGLLAGCRDLLGRREHVVVVRLGDNLRQIVRVADHVVSVQNKDGAAEEA